MKYGNVRLNRTYTTRTVVQLFVASHPEPLAGAIICRATGIKSGTIYPMLSRLKKVGWLTSSWEDIDPREAGRPRRKEYNLTSAGLVGSRELIEADS